MPDEIKISKSIRSICFLGPDGAGKSAVISRLIDQFPDTNFTYFHLKPSNPVRFSSTNVSNEQPHAQLARPIWQSILKLLLFFVQYHVGWLVHVRNVRGSDDIAIFDRYMDDMIADPARYRFSGGLFLLRALRLVIPKPDIYFVLLAQESTILSRKREVNPQELARQISAYKALSKLHNYHVISTEQEIEGTLNEIVAIIKR